MKYTNLKIGESCIKCGSCLGCGVDFLNSANDGSITVKKGTILNKDSDEFKILKDVCPVDAFEINSSISNKKQLINSLIQELSDFKGIPMPTQKELAFNKEEYYISLPSASGEYRYEYSSDSAAEKAALYEFERAMYSRMDSIILKIITEYRVRHVKPYYTTDINEGSVYAKNNKIVGEMLQAIVDLSDGKLNASFADINIFPNNELDWKLLNKGELVSDECISAVRSEMDYTASDYSFKWDTDYREMPAGTDWRGNTKYKDKYCYKNVRYAFEELSKDILNACGYAHDRMESQAVQSSSWLVQEYNKALLKVIAEKINQIKKISF